MSLASGARLGPYEILTPIGAGGMGEVYRAKDTKLNRDVALKVLPDLFATDPERLARFKREAQVLASLNHPNIAHIHGLEDSNGIHALVIELVEGPTLADRIEKGPIPLDEAFPIAKQIAEALEAAHEQGIIHRDLKPANIKVTPEGRVKVLDFGLAKALEPSSGASTSVSMSPTITTPAMTQAGMILGTAAYMSPEQARGKTVDKRADIWAFGCVLFEMLTGKRAFGGDDVSDTLAFVITKEPDFNLLPASTPAAVRTLLRRCFEKEPRRRLQAIGDARLEIDEALAASSSMTTSPGTATQAQSPWDRSVRASTVAAFTVVVVSLAVWLWMRDRMVSPRQVVRFSIGLAGSDQFSATNRRVIAVAPDGAHVAFVAGARLYLRALDQPDAREIEGTQGGELVQGQNPFFSPDSKWIGFWQGNALKKVSVTGGAPVVICAARRVFGASWGANDRIVFGQGPAGISRVAAWGGTPETLVQVQPDQSAGWPEVLPDGRTLLFTLTTGNLWDRAQIVVQSLETGKRDVLFEGSDARYVPTGHLLYGLNESLMAVAFDVTESKVVGRPITLMRSVASSGTSGVVQASISRDGTLAYAAGLSDTDERTLVWVDRKGQSQAIPAEPRGYSFPRLSPDGKKIAVSTVYPTADVLVYDIPRAAFTRLTFDGNNVRSVWTPDGTRVTFSSDRAGGLPNIYWVASDGSGSPERLTTSDFEQYPEDWAPDGKTLVFGEMRPETNWDIWTLPFPDRTPQLFMRTRFFEGARSVSPDGRWLSYYSDESGRGEVYVRPFLGGDGKWLISTDGGAESVWSRNGRELFYRSGRKLMVVDVTLQPTFAASKPRMLFEGPYIGALPANFDVSQDGQRFVMVMPSKQSPRLEMVLNWTEELKQRVPTK